MYLLSICIPTYNREKNLKEMLDSIKFYSNVEIVVCDDGSTDNTNQLVNNFTWRNLGFYLATNFYKLTRKKYRNDLLIKKLLCCPDCHNDLEFNTNNSFCINCSKEYETVKSLEAASINTDLI